MGRWTTRIGEDAIVIVNTQDGRISIGTLSGKPIIADPGDAESIRDHLGAAIGIALGTQPDPTI